MLRVWLQWGEGSWQYMPGRVVQGCNLLEMDLTPCRRTVQEQKSWDDEQV